MKKLLMIATLPAVALLAADRSQETISATQTSSFNVSAPGAIRIENSFGEVDIDGWDRSEVEVIVVRSTEHLYDPMDDAGAQRRLDSVQIKAKQDGNDVVISTAYPPRKWYTHPLSRRSDIEIHYTIHAPRASRLIIDHNSGGVNVSDIRGDIHARVINGQITLTLPAEGQYKIDAEAKIGAVYSDFDGRDRRHFLGDDFSRPDSPAATLFLRARLGDIMILKLHGPPAD